MRTIFATSPELVVEAETSAQQRVQRMFDEILPITEQSLGLTNDAAVTGALPLYSLEAVSVPTLTISFEDNLFGTWDAARFTAEHIPMPVS